MRKTYSLKINALQIVFTKVRQNPGCQNKDNKQKWAEMIEVPTETGWAEKKNSELEEKCTFVKVLTSHIGHFPLVESVYIHLADGCGLPYKINTTYGCHWRQYKWENDLFLKQVKLSTKDNCKKMNTIKNSSADFGQIEWVCEKDKYEMCQNSQISQVLESKKYHEWSNLSLQVQKKLQEKQDANVQAGILRSNNGHTWVCCVKSADKWNTGPADGHSNPPLHKWLVKTTRCLEAAPAAQCWKQWHNARGRHEASLAWVLNDMFSDVFWIRGTFKISMQVIRDLWANSSEGHYKLHSVPTSGLQI
ncbi:hypothetical protein B0H14DRAFT_2607795 [Mycena olivaceomarginata]|nr:hypothetical protein B0H14DRAFT_2607795 [Mycena olivaceomarginata]